MSSVRMWAVGRRIQYGLGFLSFWLLIGASVYYLNFYQAPNCFDLVTNGGEKGIDCGGACTRICLADVLTPQVLWSDSFEIVAGQYNAVAYVENLNHTAATPELNYTFQFFNKAGEIVAERSGVTILPPNDVYPIFEGRILTDAKQTITDTKLILETAELWLPATVGRDQFRSLDKVLTNSGVRPKLNAQIENTELVAAENIEVVATIFNDNGKPVTASQTFVERINPRSVQDIVFTWPSPIAKTVRSCEIPTDVVMGIDLSGSMNNDGGSPAQPITAALAAASQFVNSLNTKDQVAVVTFATQAELVYQFTNDHEAVAGAVINLEIAAVEETGFTNTVEALKVAEQELQSERNSGDARQVLVLLTDGLPTAAGEEDVVQQALAQAASLQEKDIEVYAIGLGQGVDRDFISRVASEESKAYFAPSGSDLANIYKEITSSLCEVGPTKIDVYAKTQTNFAPLE